MQTKLLKDNTVGSYWTNKHLQKKWVKIKRKQKLNNLQKSVVVGSLLSDGTLRFGKKAINAALKIEHGLKQVNMCNGNTEFFATGYLLLQKSVFAIKMTELNTPNLFGSEP